jgi:hypothetical protein
MHHFGQKALLFIKPSLPISPLILKAQEKRYNILVISALDSQCSLPEEIINTFSAFFQVDTNDDRAVLELVKKISQKFHIDGVIPGNTYAVPLTYKVAIYLKKPKISPEVMHRLKTHMIPIPYSRKVEPRKIVEDALKTLKIDYSVQVFIQNNVLSIVNITEKIMLFEQDFLEIGAIVCSENEPSLVKTIESYLKKVIMALHLNNGPFHMDVRLAEQGPLLVDISIGFVESVISNLIREASGIDLYDNILRLFSGQPLLLQRTKRLTAGLIFCYSSRELETLRDNSYVKELIAYDKGVDVRLPMKAKVGHALLVHEDDQVLRHQMVEASVLARSFNA